MCRALILIVAALCCASCNSDVIVHETKELAGSWNKDEVIEFTIPRLDSLKNYNLFIHLRNTNEYKYNNIFLITTLKFPHGKQIIDTLEYRMANADGSWLGQGIGSVKDNKLWYKEGISFMENGDYNIIITQAVRNNGNVEGVTELEGIIDVGYSIEEVIQQ